MLTTSESQDKPLSQDEYERCKEIIMNMENRHIMDYHRPSGLTLRRVGDNYKNGSSSRRSWSASSRGSRRPMTRLSA